MSTSTPFPAAGSGDEVNPPATDPEDTNPHENDPDDAVAVNPPSPPIPSNDDEDADQVAGSRATRPVSGNQD